MNSASPPQQNGNLLGTAIRVLDLGHEIRTGMPRSPSHPEFRLALIRRHGDKLRADGGSGANESITFGAHTGTHIDALSHVAQDGILHGGVKAADVTSAEGFTTYGAEQLAPYVGRAVLLDIAALHSVDVLDPDYEITVSDLEAALEKTGSQIFPGNAVIIATGWSKHWSNPDTFRGDVLGAPGPGSEAGDWLVSKKVGYVGGETIAFEHIPAGRGHATLPVHRKLLVEAGVPIIEMLNLVELVKQSISVFTIVLAPIKLAGATGSPLRPLALLPN